MTPLVTPLVTPLMTPLHDAPHDAPSWSPSAIRERTPSTTEARGRKQRLCAALQPTPIG